MGQDETRQCDTEYSNMEQEIPWRRNWEGGHKIKDMTGNKNGTMRPKEIAHKEEALTNTAVAPMCHIQSKDPRNVH